MKTNPNDPAHPVVADQLQSVYAETPATCMEVINPGMTIRQAFSMAAMQGLCTNYLREGVTGWDIQTYAAESVALADALIDALNEEQSKTT